jgi:hypothetical protein
LNDTSLQKVANAFDILCNQHNIPYKEIPSNPGQFKVLLQDKSRAGLIEKEIWERADDENICMSTKDRQDGVLFNFGIVAEDIAEDGHWDLLSPKRKRSEFTLFANRKDASRVRAGKTMYQGYYKKAKKESEENTAGPLSEEEIAFLKQVFEEDQYKVPTRRMIRKQSAWPSSFGPTRSFGGISRYNHKTGKKVVREQTPLRNRLDSIAGQMIPPTLEPPSNVGIVGASKTAFPTKDQDPTVRAGRKDLTDIPTKPPFKPPKLAGLSQPLDKKIKDAIQARLKRESTIPGTRLGRTNERAKRTLVTGKLVPDATRTAENPSEVIDLPDATDQDIQTSPTLVIPSDTASRTADRLDVQIAQQRSYRPLGLFGPADLRQPNGQPVSNVSVQHPPDRSFDANRPKISVNRRRLHSTADDLYRELMVTMGQA